MPTAPSAEQIRELNRQYLPRYTVNDADDYVRRSNERSAKARKLLDCQLDVAYGSSDRQLLDIFPSPNPGSPVLVFIHGGYWRARDIDRRTYSHLAKPFVKAGATVVLPEYDLCPSVSITDIVAQMRAALVWVYKRIGRFNGKPSKIYLSGHSAGGHLTGMMSATDWQQCAGLPNTLIKGSAPLSGLFDIQPHRHTDLQTDIRLGAREAKRLSPMYLPAIARGPVLAAVGGAEPDLFHWQSLQYAAELRAQGIPAEYLLMPDDHHFSITDRLGKASDPLTRKIIALMGL